VHQLCLPKNSEDPVSKFALARTSSPTRTTGLLHFEDLKPQQFEDLRLLYDFRPWIERADTSIDLFYQIQWVPVALKLMRLTSCQST
jgi:hypothetical protein